MCERLYCGDFLFIRKTWQSPSLGANFSYTKLCSVKYGGKALGYFECIPTHFSLEVREANRKSRRTRRWTKQLESRPAFHCLRFSLKTRSREWARTKEKWWCLKRGERSRVPYPEFMLYNLVYNLVSAEVGLVSFKITKRTMRPDMSYIRCSAQLPCFGNI